MAASELWMMIVWRLGGKIIRTVLYAVLCTTVAHSDTYTCEYFLNLQVDLGLYFVFVCVSLGLTFSVFLC